MKVETKLLCGIAVSISLLTPQLTKAQTDNTTTANMVIVTHGTTDMNHRYKDYMLDSNYYPARRRAQLRDFSDNQYLFAPKPRNMWEIGVGGGLYDQMGDVPSEIIGKNGSYGFNVSVRKSWSYVFSTRLQYIYSVSKGMGYQLVDQNVDRSFQGYGDAQIVPNYRTESHQLNLDLMFNMGNVSFSRAHNSVSFYGFVGMGALAFQTRANTLDANGNPYNYAAIIGNTAQTAANKATIQNKLNKAMDNSYETLAETQSDKTHMGNKTVDFAPSVGIGAEFRLNSRINLQIEDRLTVPAGEDLLDGVRFANSATPQLTVSNDVTNYASVGINFNIGSRHKHTEPLYWINPMNYERRPMASPAMVAVVDNTSEFSMRAPKLIPLNSNIKESFPIRNSVFFDEGSTEIPSRYVLLNKGQAGSFTEQQLGNASDNDNHAYSRLSIYYNVLNIVGDRMRSNPQSTITLKHASGRNDVADGRTMAEHVKQYLVDNFGIDASRITVDGEARIMEPEKDAPQQTLAELRADNRRVDIESNSPELLTEVSAGETPYMRPVQTMARQQDPLDSFVLFNVDGALKDLNSWSVQVTDDHGAVQRFGPYMQEQAAIPISAILGSRTEGNYEIVMSGQKKDGSIMRKESSLNLVTFAQPGQIGSRYSILFGFDKANTVATYQKFLTDVVVPAIPENGIVFIHGHTDNIGTPKYNEMLSQERAMGVQKILEDALAKAGTQGVTFQTYGFGEEATTAPFNNTLPENHFYNRTVVIDVVANKH